ncbi:DUF4231 domain-containing protein [candidate division KSB1 bacterium]|nr:DUF4231 domain-containing protein [candidate division KSB1 bacterium]
MSTNVVTKPDLQTLLQNLTLDEIKKNALQGRWLDQMKWMSGRAKHTKSWYFRLRLTAIIGGLLIPALVSVNNFKVGATEFEVKWVVFALGLIVAICGAVEEFFRFGERWRHYRQHLEALKTEGWQFVQLIGNYSSEQYPTHAAAYTKFATRIEEILQREVGVYVTEVMAKKDEKKPEPAIMAAQTNEYDVPQNAKVLPNG